MQFRPPLQGAFQGLGQPFPMGLYRPQPAIQPAPGQPPIQSQPPVPGQPAMQGQPPVGGPMMGLNPALLAHLQQMGGLGGQRPQLPIGLGRYGIQPISNASVGSLR